MVYRIAFVAFGRTFVVGTCDILDGLRGCGGEAVGNAELSSDTCGHKFAFRAIELVDADGREADWCRDAVPEERGCKRNELSDIGEKTVGTYC